MSADTCEPLRLPASAIPGDCRAWESGQAGAWTDALPPWWLPLRARALVVLVALLGALLLPLGGQPAVVSALLPLQLVWLTGRPEAVRFTAPALVVAVAVERPDTVLTAVALVVAVGVLVLAELRLRARVRQRGLAVEAAGGVTVAAPDRDRRPARGAFLIGFGAVVTAVGAALVATHGLWSDVEDRRDSASVGWLVAGLGLTLLLSGLLGRRRALALRAAPVPVLRVLVRQRADLDMEVFAADDVTALRPLLTVPVTNAHDDEDGADDEEEERELNELLDALEDGRPGPLREAVLYGVPCDGAEVLLVSAPTDPRDPPSVEWSTGPVQPLVSASLARRAAREKRDVARTAREEARIAAAARAAAAVMAAVPVRSWRAGAVDRLVGALMVLAAVCVIWATYTDSAAGRWQQILMFVLGLFGAGRCARHLAWRITADRTGLWINGFRKDTHVLWDDLRPVRREAFQVELRWNDGSWEVGAPRWDRLQRRYGLTHPYDTLAAEVTVLRDDPALRPTADSDPAERARPLWPLTALLAAAWTAAVVCTLVWF
ncbi:hypothetical protein [Streptomyces mangrovisoli]|uniref:Uncharacterized protein n=1 Tax=Streptomyces mangrovisoli TaxID=1428628 RepID=A0A1J4NU89_9ACTN|nr:hypothetical protein [Streptomyces mangrovisoli]OIJ65084.1 hypothetical protein WN71_025050 [Streptomyces mangrovisoli]